MEAVSVTVSLIGKTLHGYLIRGLLGKGGMGVVYEGYKANLDKRAAIKVLNEEYAQKRDHTARFMNEAISNSRVKQPGSDDMHENVVNVEHVDTDDEGRPYIVYEFLEGSDLDARVRSFGPAPVDFAASVLLQVCRVLDAAHAAGIVHRDLKPANIFITRRPGRDPFVKLLDFGIAKLRSDMRATGVVTGAGIGMGTPLFMSPEQAHGQHVDARADIFALGGVIYYVLTSRHTYPDDTPYLQILDAQREGRLPPPLTQLRPDLDPRWDTILARCLAYNRENRYPNVRMLAQDIKATTQGGPAIFEKVWPDYQASPDDLTVRNDDGSVLSPRSAAMPSAALTSHSAAAGARPSTRATTSRRWMLVMAALVVVAALGVIAVTLAGRTSAGGDRVSDDVQPASGVLPDAGAIELTSDAATQPVDTARTVEPSVDAGVVAAPAPTIDAGGAGGEHRRRTRRSRRSSATSPVTSSAPPASSSTPPVDAAPPPPRKKKNPDDLLLGR